MKQIVEVDPATVAFRTVADSYTEGAFECGVFRVPLGELSGRKLENLQAIAAQEALLSDGTRPNDSFKFAVGQLACVSKLPSMLRSASYLDISSLVNEVLAPFEGPTEEELRQVYGDAPNPIESYFIHQAKQQITIFDLLVGHPDQKVKVPEIFLRVLPEAEEHFRLFTRAARFVLLSRSAKEYLVGTQKNSWKSITLSPALEPLAHLAIIDWDDEEKLVEKFIEEHGHVQGAGNYVNLSVGLDHADDMSRETSVLTNNNANQVGKQFANLLTQLAEIRRAKLD